MRMRLGAAGALAALGLVAMGIAQAQACATDGIPSMIVDGHLVAVNKASVSKKALARWTPFVARGTYMAGHALSLREDRIKIMLSLPPVYFKYPWRWEFGDGTSSRGLTARHTYRHPGTYVVTVKAYLVGGRYKNWYAFDAVTVHVR